LKKLAVVCFLLFAISAFSQSQSITVTSPNGGEDWALGSTHNITWRSSGMTGKVNILLFNGEQRVGVIQSDVPVASGSISWVVGNYQGGTAAPGTNYKIRTRKPQTEILDSSDRPFTISGTAPAASLSVTSPNGGETWFTNAVHEALWTSSGISGSVTIRLKKGGVVVRSWTAENTGSSLGDYSWAQAGTDYKIRVENSTGSVFDESDRNFTIQVLAGPTPPPPAGKRDVVPAIPSKQSHSIQVILLVTDFKLNNGAETTESGIVTMDHVIRGAPTYYRWRTEARPDWGPWVRYIDAHPKANIPESVGEHTIYFQVKDNYGESAAVSDSIRYVKKDLELEYGPGAIADCPCPNGPATGWKRFSVIEQSFPTSLVGDPTQVVCADNHGGCYWGLIIEVKSLGYMFVRYGAKTEFEFFAGRQLNEGWSFVRLEYEGEEGEGYGYRITRMPQPGGRDITFRVRVWVDSDVSSCTFKINKIVVKGPAGRPVEEAFQ